MPTFNLQRRLVAEALGTAFLLTTVVGSGIMAQSLTHDTALVLLANSLATGAVLTVLITVLGPISGAHFNPAVTLVAFLGRHFPALDFGLYIGAQLVGGLIGVVVAHLMFALPVWELSLKARTGTGQWLAEGVATFGLVVTILASQRLAPRSLPRLVGLFIVSAYWFTSSTSFANPAVTLARSFTNTVAGIRLADVPMFVLAQLGSAMGAAWVMRWLLREHGANASESCNDLPPAEGVRQLGIRGHAQDRARPT